MRIRCAAFGVVLSLWAAGWMAAGAAMPSVQLSKDGRHFVLSPSGAPFKAWGVNYDHDDDGRLLEDYWEKEWPTVTNDFAEIKALGANTVRIHLQTGRFMKSTNEPNQQSLDQLAKLVAVAERTGLYLDVTGLGCYHKKDVPAWYNALDEGPRWDVQARFWEAVAKVCHRSPAIFCYDLMNEPVLTEDQKGRDWTPGAFGESYFVQRLSLDFAGRSTTEIAKQWVDKMAAAIRRHDKDHLVTVGAIPWALTWTNAKPLFYSKTVSEHLDFASVHFYPKNGEVDKAITALRVYDIGKPLVIEEMFPLECSVDELDQFIERSKPIADGWIGFYWGKPVDEYRSKTNDISAGIIARWLEYFKRKAPGMAPQPGKP